MRPIHSTQTTRNANRKCRRNIHATPAVRTKLGDSSCPSTCWTVITSRFYVNGHFEPTAALIQREIFCNLITFLCRRTMATATYIARASPTQPNSTFSHWTGLFSDKIRPWHFNYLRVSQDGHENEKHKPAYNSHTLEMFGAIFIQGERTIENPQIWPASVASNVPDATHWDISGLI